MPLQPGSRVRVAWDDPSPEGNEVMATVIGAIALLDRESPGWLVKTDHPVTAEGATKSHQREVRTGSFLTLATRYVGQEWDDEGVVQVNLYEDDPRERQLPWLWVASHGVYAVSA